MTFSILARDPETGALGGAAATGSLCVGGWVLRGALDAGMSASQGAAPSTLWGDEVLEAMRGGAGAQAAVSAVTSRDPGCDWRQLSALDRDGQGAGFTGATNTPEMGHRAIPGGIVAGNMLTGLGVLDALADGFATAEGGFSERLLAALRGATAAGGDNRGLLSAALLVLHPERAPLTLRIDHHPTDPIGALADLHRRATTGAYADWAAQVPTLADPARVLGG